MIETASPLSGKPAPLRPLAGFGVVFRWGLLRSLASARFRGAVFVLALLGAGLGLAASRDRDPTFAFWSLSFDYGVLGVGVPLLALALVGSGFAEEVDEQTLVFHLVRPVSRTTVFLARFLSGAIPAVIAGIVVALANILVSGVEVARQQLFPMLTVVALGVVTVGAVYYALGALFRRGLVAGLVYTFVVEGAFQWFPGSIQRFSLMRHVRSVFHGWSDPAFASASESIRAEIERLAAPRSINLLRPDTVSFLKAAAQEPWTDVSTALLVCASVVVLVLLVGARVVARKDYALKE